MPGKSPRRSSETDRSFRRMSGEEKVNLAVEMSSVAMALTLDSIRDHHPGITTSKMFELARKRMRVRHSVQQDVDDIRGILANTRVNMSKILDQARKDGHYRDIDGNSPSRIRSKMNKTANSLARLVGIALIAGPVVFVFSMVVEQSLRPGFSVLSNTISDLGVDTNGWSYSWIFTASIIVLGLLTLLAAYGLTGIFGRSALTGAILLSLAGLGYIGVGIFNVDAHFVEHSIFALDQFVATTLAILTLARVLGKDPRLGHSYANFSRGCGLISLVFLVLFLVGIGSPAYRGLIERLVVAPVLLWSLITGLRLWTLPQLGSPASVSASD